MVKDTHTHKALLDAKDQLLAAYASVHSSLGHLIGLVQHSDPRVIAETLGSGSGLPIAPHAARFAHTPQAAPQQVSQHLPSHHPHGRQASHNGTTGPSFTTVTPYAPHNRSQYSANPHHQNSAGFTAAESEEEEDDDEHEDPSEEDLGGAAHAPQHTYAPAAEQPGAKKGAREKKVKRERDPNAPKRPASAYILFQNAVRQEMRAANPTADYKELARQIGDRWKSLDEEAKKPWSEAGKQAMSSWNIQNREYKSLHPETTVQTTSPHALSNGSSAPAAPPKRRRTAPAVDADGNPIKKKRGRPSKSDKVDEVTPIQPQQPQQPQTASVAPRKPEHWPQHPSQQAHMIATNGGGYHAAPPQQLPRPAVQADPAGDDEDEDDAAEGDTDSDGEDGTQPPSTRPPPPTTQPAEDEDDEEDAEEEEEEEEEEDSESDSHTGKKMRPNNP